MWKLQGKRNIDIATKLQRAGMDIKHKRLNNIFTNPFYR